MLALLLLVVAGLGGPAIAQPAHKSFTAAIGPAVAAAGEAGSFTATLVNTGSQQQLGSADLDAPSGWTVEHVGTPAVDGAPTGTAAVGPSGVTVELRDLAASPGSEVTVAFTATAPCDPGPYTFGARAKQANDFRGPPGNDLDLDAAGSDLTVAVEGGCGVALRFFAQPAHAEVDAVVSSVPGDPSATPVQVEVVAEDGTRATSSDATITIAFGDNPSGATLSGTTTRTAVAGLASFDGLTIDRIGSDFTLVATATGLAGAESRTFSVWEEVTVCDPGSPCTNTVERRNAMRVDVSGTSGQRGVIFSSISDEEFGCGDDFNHAPHTTVVDTFEFDGHKTAEIRIDKRVVQQDVNRGAAHYQVCYEGDAPFTDRDGRLVEAGDRGLLGDCQSGAQDPTPPCLMGRNKDKAGDMLITALLPENDPKFR